MSKAERKHSECNGEVLAGGIRDRRMSGPASRESTVARRISLVFVRPALHLLPWNRMTIRIMRRVVERVTPWLSPVPVGTTIYPIRDPGVVGEWVSSDACSSRNAKVIFYVHGGAYVAGSTRTHRGLVARLSSATGLRAFSCDYRLAPEHPFPAATEDVANAFEWLIGQGYQANDIVAVGDSAGGQLLTNLMLDRARSRLPQPAAIVLMSPGIDLTCELSTANSTRRDAIFTLRSASALLSLYTANTPPDARGLKLDFSAAKLLPPTLIQAGSDEMLSGDAHHLATELQKAGVACELEFWPQQMHVFQLIENLPEAGAALARIATFVNTLAGQTTEGLRQAT